MWPWRRRRRKPIEFLGYRSEGNTPWPAPSEVIYEFTEPNHSCPEGCPKRIPLSNKIKMTRIRG